MRTVLATAARRLSSVALIVAGALGFLTRFPVGQNGDAWTAFTENSAAAVVPGYVVGLLGAAVLVCTAVLVPALPAATAAFAYVVAIYALVGVNNLDGVADCGDAAVVHGDPARRREVLADTTTGVGAIAAVALAVAGLVLGAVALADVARAGVAEEAAAGGVLDAVAVGGVVATVGVVVAAEVGARLGLAGLAAFGDAPHEGLGSKLTAGSDSWTFVVACWLAAPAVLWPVALGALGVRSVGTPAVVVATAGALGGALGATVLVGRWARSNLGGPSGDVFGAATELARVAGLHVGVIAWTL